MSTLFFNNIKGAFYAFSFITGVFVWINIDQILPYLKLIQHFCIAFFTKWNNADKKTILLKRSGSETRKAEALTNPDSFPLLPTVRFPQWT